MNKKLWQNYKSSEEGKRLIELFSLESNDDRKLLEGIIEYSKKCQPRMANIDDIKTEYIVNGVYFLADNLSCQNLKIKDETLEEDYEKLINDFFLTVIVEDEKGNISCSTDERDIQLKANDFRRKSSFVFELSLYLYIIHPHFKPILFPYSYDLILRNCDALGIELPPIPHTKDYKAFLMYYFDICCSMNAFQQEYEMTDEEFCACFYGLAEILCEEPKQVALPKPVNVWLTGASGGDFKSLDEATKDDYEGEFNSVWACNERTKRGDIIVMYCTSPRSYIHSIWRANSNGIFNPFTYYQKMTTVCNGIEVPKVTFQDLKEDSYWSQVPIVRGNLQGLNGVEITAEQYEKLLEIFKRKGMSLRNIPKLFSSKSVDFGTIKIEKIRRKNSNSIVEEYWIFRK